MRNSRVLKFLKKHKDAQWVTYLIDGICIAFLLLACFHNQFTFGAKEAKDYDAPAHVSALITVLLPTVITVVSITLSLSKEKTHGLTIKEFNAIRAPFCFTPLHISLVMSSCILLYAIFSLVGNYLGVLVLGIIAFLYSLYFFVQEMPIASQSGWMTGLILRHRKKRRGADDSLPSQKSEKIFDKAVTNLILNEGIVTAYQTLKGRKDGTGTLSFILDCHNDYLWDLLENSPSRVDIAWKYKGIEICDVIRVSYENVERLISEDADFNYVSILGGKSYYQATRLLFSLHKLCLKADMQGKEAMTLRKIVTSYLCTFLSRGKEQKPANATAAMVSMSINAIQTGEAWFLEGLRDNNINQEYAFNFSQCPFGFFIAMVIAYALRVPTTGKEKKDKLRSFLASSCRGLNSTKLSWNEIIKRSFDYDPKTEDVVSSLKWFLIFYHSIDDNEFIFWPDGKQEYISSSRSFKLSELFSEWIEMLFYASLYKDEPGNLKEVINSLEPEDKKALCETLSGRWLEADHLKANVPTLFIDAYLGGERICFDKRVVNKPILSTLVEFKNDYEINEVNKELAASKNFKENETEKAVKAARKAITGAPFYDQTLPLVETKDKCVKYLIRDFDCSPLLNGILKSLPTSILWLINEEIKNKVKTKMTKDFYLGDNEVKEIIDLKANVTSALLETNFYINNGGKYAKELEALSLKDVPGVPGKLFARDGAIRFNAEVDAKETIVRPLTDNELEDMIQRDCTLYPTGLYRYSKYENDEQHSFFVTKEQLKGYLEKTTMFILIVFKTRIEIDSEACVRFETKLEDE